MIVIDDRLETAMFGFPFSVGWEESTDVTLTPYAVPAQVEGSTLAIIDSIAALTMLQTHVIVRDIAVVSRRASMLTLETHTRPDDVEAVSAAIAGISPAGRAVATAVLQPFYGISVTEWTEVDHPVDETHARVTEGAEALIAIENDAHYQEDLGRAWFLMSDRPYVSHLAVAPRSRLVSSPESIAHAVERLLAARANAIDRGRELRRDISNRFGIDRETLTETLADQSHSLDDEAVEGLSNLVRRSGLPMAAKDLRAALVSLQQS